jgi:hypothetical protein
MSSRFTFGPPAATPPTTPQRFQFQITDPPVVTPARKNNPGKRNLREETEQYLLTHPYVYALFVQFAMEKKARFQKFGAKHLAERVRWECELMKGETEEYLLNNNYTAYIARKLVADYPELVMYVNFRKTRY